jgi:cysteine desulfurase/selenocysteine lyase
MGKCERGKERGEEAAKSVEGGDLSPTASKLDTSLVWFAALAEQAAFGIFRQFGIEALLHRNAQLSQRLHDALVAHRSALRALPQRHCSTIVSVPVDDTDAVMTRLRKANVVASVREGRVQLSVHFYNLEEEIDRAAELIGSAWSRFVSIPWRHPSPGAAAA